MEFGEERGFRDEVVTGGVGPEAGEVGVVDENIGGCARSVGAVFEIVDATVENKRAAVGVEEDGGERVVLIAGNELAWGLTQ